MMTVRVRFFLGPKCRDQKPEVSEYRIYCTNGDLWRVMWRRSPGRQVGSRQAGVTGAMWRTLTQNTMSIKESQKSSTV